MQENRQRQTHRNWSRERSCGRLEGEKWNATTGPPLRPGRARCTKRLPADVEGSMGLIILIAVRCSPWCIFILQMHILPADIYMYRPRSVTPLTGIALSSTYSCLHGKQITMPAISATVQCDSSLVPAPCPVPGTHQQRADHLLLAS